MLSVRPAIAVDPRRFGRAVAPSDQPAERVEPMNADLKLFMTTFAAGFLFVSVILA